MPHQIDANNPEADWEAIYEAGDARWDLGDTAPPFAALLADPPCWLSPGTLLNAGCGRGHDAVAFARRGFGVTALDCAPSAAAAVYAQALRLPTLQVVLADAFDPPAALLGSFDYVLEHTFFCTVPPARRGDWLAAVKAYLKPGGIVFGLFYRFDPPDANGPPFAVNEAELRALVAADFEVLEWTTPPVSAHKRQGRERFIALRLREATPEADTQQR